MICLHAVSIEKVHLSGEENTNSPTNICTESLPIDAALTAICSAQGIIKSVNKRLNRFARS
jgi:hypothetical protein